MTDIQGFWPQWQADYEKATGHNGKVTNVFGRMGRFGGLAIWVEVEENGETAYYSPYLNSSPGDGEHDDEHEHCACESCEYETDSDAWLDSMVGAADWGDWDWGQPEFSIPEH